MNRLCPRRYSIRNGNLITELFSDEKREIVPVDKLPKHLIYALISREDQYFFEHNGMSFRHFFRALYNIIAGNYFSGFSTLTMQVAGNHYTDRTEISLTRKIQDVWYAYQIEKALTKNEILEIYINEAYFGHGTYGVESASQFYFGHSASEISHCRIRHSCNPACKPGALFSHQPSRYGQESPDRRSQ